MVADATSQSQTPGSPGYTSTIYSSFDVVNLVFEGDFTADANTTKLALLSDDGCNVTIDGARVLSHFNQTQHLPVLSESLSLLPITLNPGQTYHIRIDYSNVNGQPIGYVDGCTLFAFKDTPPSVSMTADDPGDPDAFQQVTSKVYASVDHLPSGHFTADLTATWTWTILGVSHSDTRGGNFLAVNASPFSLVGNNSDLTAPTATFTGTFNLDGFYRVEVQATVKYHDNRTGEDLGAYGPGHMYLGDTDK